MPIFLEKRVINPGCVLLITEIFCSSTQYCEFNGRACYFIWEILAHPVCVKANWIIHVCKFICLSDSQIKQKPHEDVAKHTEGQ